MADVRKLGSRLGAALESLAHLDAGECAQKLLEVTRRVQRHE